jgi:hypothetical protein
MLQTSFLCGINRLTYSSYRFCHTVIANASFTVCRNPAAGFPALASEHLVPIPGGRHAQQKPGGSKKPRKRSCKASQDINKRCKDDQNDKQQ